MRLRAERAGGRVRIAVQDTGQGIEPSLLPLDREWERLVRELLQGA